MSEFTSAGEPSESGNPLARLFMQHRERLWRLVHFRIDARLRGRMDVEDVLQEAYLAAGQRIEHMPDDDERVYVWVRLIVLQTLTDLYRRHIGTQKRNATREIFQSIGDGAQTTRSIMGELIGDLTSPSGHVRRDEMSTQMKEALDQLKDSDAEILVLRHFEELSNTEAAEVLGLSVKAASIRYVRALGRFREILRSMPDFSISNLS